MSKIYQNFCELVGRTPLLETENIEKGEHLSARLLVKLECMNPAGSVKDRAAKGMIEDAEARGLLREGSIIVEPTSGNTGIGLAAVAASKGYRVILTMPDSMSMERRRLLAAYGAELVLTEGSLGMKGAVERAEAIAAETPGAFLAGQFVNPANAAAHFATTGPEIFEDTDGEVDIFVAGIGTGGTITGVGGYLKSVKPSVQVIGVEPDDSPLLSEGRAGPHKLQGIGANFIPEVLDRSLVDEIFRIKDADAFYAVRLLARQEGILVGISSGAALHAAIEAARLPKNAGRTVVALLPDTGDRYLSTGIFD